MEPGGGVAADAPAAAAEGDSDAAADFAAAASALVEEVARRDEAARAEAFQHMRRRASEGGLNANGSESGVPELVGSRTEVMRMLNNRIERGDARSVRRAREKVQQLQRRSGA